MMSSELRYWLALNATGSFTGRHLERLQKHFGELKAVFYASYNALCAAGLTAKQTQAIKSFNLNSIKVDLNWAEQKNHHLIVLTDPHYPELLKQINDPPLVLSLLGDPELLHYPQLAIVGSRKPTPAGIKNAGLLAGQLAAQGLIITSGMALGIDAASHWGALKAKGYSIAVLGTSIDQVYPQRNRPLFHELKEKGIIISEFPLGTQAHPYNFPRRNRIISGLSLGTLVIEAALASGSLITAKLAAEQGREVFALPGSIHNLQAKGCHSLLKNGAFLVETSEDILFQLAPLLEHHYPQICSKSSPTNRLKNNQKCIKSYSNALFSQEKLDFNQLDKDHKALLQCVGDEPTSIEALITQTGFTATQVSAMLVELELQGLLVASAGGYCRMR